MIYLRTGSNGSCKTLFTLADVRAMQLKENRRVCVNGRFKIKPEKLAEFDWKVIDFKEWQAEPDGTIFLIDECHNDMPVRSNGSTVPEPIRMLAEHRSRGFDFFLLTQHPANIDAFVRKIIGAPGWHQHLKRQFGGTSLTNVLQWDAVRMDCEKDGSGKSAQVTTRAQPKEVFHWYDSATIHTAKTRIPKQLYVLVACLVIVPALGWFGFKTLQKVAGQTPTPVASAPGVSGAAPAPRTVQGDRPAPMSTAEMLASYTPRIPGLPQTAPRYDEVTKPTTAPYPAACVHMGKRCDCFTQQGTRMDTPFDLCKQIVSRGFFQDWTVPVNPGTVAPASGQNDPQTTRKDTAQGNPGADPAVVLAEVKAETGNSGDLEALAAIHWVRRSSL